MPTFKIQNAPRIDHITDDGTAMTQLPYPIHADDTGQVQVPEIHAGTLVRVIGFQEDLARHEIDLWWADAQKDPTQAVGMYVVTTDDKGGMGVHMTAVDTFEKVGH